MHPELSRQLFDEQVSRIAGNPELLVDRGWLVLKSAYPELRVAVKHNASGLVRVFHFECEDWNDQPPALKLVDAETGGELPGTSWPKDNAPRHWHPSGWTSEGGIATPKAFMCMVGIREYHTHHSHIGDRWENYKDLPGYDLPGIVVQVTEVFQKSDV
jgi:hypothetical protein